MEYWKRCGVSLSFALSGGLAALPFEEGFKSHSNLLIGWVGASFGLLAFALIWRSVAGALVVPIIAGTWYLAYYAAITIGMIVGDILYIPMLLGGLIGGLGLAICRVIAQGKNEPALTARICVIAVGSAISLGPWLTQYQLHVNSPQGIDQTIRLAIGFAVWQGVMGTLLYLLRPAKTPASEENTAGQNTRILD
ncbi:MAG: hypothetical protein QM757_46570 [Paludibaculum sp.]